MTVRLTQMARNGTVCQACRNRIAARLIATNATQAMSTHDERVQVKACPDHPEALCRSRPARLAMAAAGCGGTRRTKRETDTSPPTRPRLSFLPGAVVSHHPPSGKFRSGIPKAGKRPQEPLRRHVVPPGVPRHEAQRLPGPAGRQQRLELADLPGERHARED